jgi:hypothetical protein
MTNSLEAKIVVLGSQGVGKTSLVHRYVKNAFTPPDLQSTIGASFLTKRVVDIDTSTVVRLQIWDTAGQERFRSISKLYYRGMFAFGYKQLTLFTPLSRHAAPSRPARYSRVAWSGAAISWAGCCPRCTHPIGNRAQHSNLTNPLADPNRALGN